MIGLKKHTKEKAWISDETFDLINRKREAKQKDNIECKQLKWRFKGK